MLHVAVQCEECNTWFIFISLVCSWCLIAAQYCEQVTVLDQYHIGQGLILQSFAPFRKTNTQALVF